MIDSEMILMNFCSFWRLKFSKLTKLRAKKCKKQHFYFKFSKLEFPKNLSDTKILKFLHCETTQLKRQKKESAAHRAYQGRSWRGIWGSNWNPPPLNSCLQGRVWGRVTISITPIAHFLIFEVWIGFFGSFSKTRDE